MLQINWCLHIPLQPFLFQTQQPHSGPCFSLLHRPLSTGARWALTGHIFNSVPFLHRLGVQYNRQELGCSYLNLSWTSFSNLSDLLICRAGSSVLLSNQCFCPIYFYSHTLSPPRIFLPALPPSLQTAFLFLPSSPLSSLLAVQTTNSHHPSASDNCINWSKSGFPFTPQQILYFYKFWFFAVVADAHPLFFPLPLLSIWKVEMHPHPLLQWG